ncbi:hypothetical protein CHS0354_026701 [Potamilus streckersoni]|uniref:Uncharacterized protein n=1 Tax=Potamilus streckersoni TaxID=2493646 RepID=A0AAE0S7X1_9BIVA|nr:hypothetical protein CHS0354_026701 [Potamilus streckersoni]
MSQTKPLYGPKAFTFLGLTNLFVLFAWSGALVYVEDKTFTTNYFEGDAVYTDNHTTTKFIHCVSVCVKECMPPCPLISFTDGICRCHTSYARINNGQYATNRDRTMYFRIDTNNDGGKETANVTTTANPIISKSSSLGQEESEYSSFTTDIVCTNKPSTADLCKIVPDGEYYIKVFNTFLRATFYTNKQNVFLTLSYWNTFNFKHQLDGSYLIYVKNNMTTNYFLHVNGSSLYVKLSDASSHVNQTYYFLEYQPKGIFRIKVKSLDYYIATSGIVLSLTNDAYGDNRTFIIETDRPIWDVIFRIPIGSPYNIYQAFLYGTKQLMTDSCEVNTDGTCHYSFTRKDGLLRDWWNGCLRLCKVKFSLTQNMTELFFLVFVGLNTSPETWFVETKLQMCNIYPNITDVSLTAAQSGDWYFTVAVTRLKRSIFAAHYDNLANTSSPNRKLTAVVLGNESKKPIKTERM